jgi:methionine biosynthesis protein MetW
VVVVERMHYGGGIDPADTNDPRSRIVRCVRAGSRVLEIGCGSGTIIAYLIREQGCTGLGVELDEHMAAEAAESGVRVIQKDIEADGTQRELSAQPPFDYVIMADVLEHLRRPRRLLEAARDWLVQDGEVLASVPNVAYWRVRLMLLSGRWDYTDGHIMDRSHLFWYTRETVRRLFQDAGYTVTELQDRWAPLPGERVWRKVIPARQRLYAWLARRWPGLFAYQFVVRARSVRERGS